MGTGPEKLRYPREVAARSGPDEVVRVEGMQMRWCIRLVAVAAAVCATVSPALGTERHVPGEYGTIQAAIDACVAGDVVLVADGTYTGAGNKDLDFGGRAITVRSASGDPNACIIDCQGSGRGFYFHTNETAAAIVQGFTIRNGKVTNESPGGYYGGGIYSIGSSPTFSNCTITRNTSSWYGGGVCLISSSATITNCTIAGNSSDTEGGGVSLVSSPATVANSTITGNSTFNRGGGLSSSGSTPTIVGNTITGNTVYRDGGGLYVSSAAMIANNRITGNDVCGLYLDSCSATIANNTITGNNGCGLYLEYSPATIANTIVAFNAYGIYRRGGSPTLRCNCVYGNSAYNYFDLTDPTGTNGNISADPAIAGWMYGRWHLQPDSPCVGAGDNAYAYGGSDLDGQARIQPAGGTVDIGADEADGTPPPADPFVVVRVSPLGADEHDGSSWTLAKRTVQAGIDAASALGGDVWVQAGTYYERITLKPLANVYGGFDGSETARDERDWKVHVTTLDGQQQGTVVTAGSLANAACTVDGFTITHGSAPKGGGFYLSAASPTIANNTIVDNSASEGGGLCLSASAAPIANNTIAGNNASTEGGGLCVSSSSPVIANNTIVSNYSADAGGGLCLVGSAPTITNNTITGNTAATFGGGLYMHSSAPTIANNTITDNRTSLGGAFYLAASAPTITSNTIRGNRASSWGGGLLLTTASPTIANNTITDNSADSGGGLYLYDGSSPVIANNTIAGNGASSGGGLYLADSSTAAIANTIVAFNSSGIYGSGGSPTLRNNCVYGNRTYNYSGIADPTGTSGNISADPAIAGWAYGKWHVRPDSPCVGAGNNAYVYGTLDLDGQARIQPAGGTVDIGADESDGTTPPEGPFVIVRVSPAGDDEHDGSSWDLAKRSVQAAVDTAASVGGEVWVQAGTYYEQITLLPFAHMYGGFSGNESTRDERDWTVHVTTLDGQQQGSVVTGRTGYAISTLDGFTITGGSADRGGGVYLYCSSPMIANNTITGNSAGNGGGLNLEVASPTIVNNTITGNQALVGGGLSLSSSSPMITSNTITDNSASSQGGGLYLYYSSPTISGNAITGNYVFEGGNGGGLALYRSSPMIAHNTIIGHVACKGGGLYLSSSAPVIVNNIIAGNTAMPVPPPSPSMPSSRSVNNTLTGERSSSAGDGGGLFLDSSSPMIANNTICGNEGVNSGGGMALTRGSAPTIANNTISGNFSADGGGLFLESSSPKITNNTITNNAAQEAGGGLLLSSSSTPTVINCVLWADTPEEFTVWSGNPVVTYCDVQGGWAGTGNINADPQFRNANGPDNVPNTWTDNDYRLSPGSPCIDAGSNSAVPPDTPDFDGDGNTTELLPFDLDGQPRFVDDSGTPDCRWAPGTCGAAPIVDMGAYEFRGTTHLAGDLDCDGVVGYGDIGPFVLALSGQASYEGRFPNCRYLNADVNGDGVVSFADINPFVALLSRP